AGQLRPDHHLAVLALAVHAVQQAERAPVVGGQLAALERLEARDEQIDVGLAGEPEAAGWGVRDLDDAHDDRSGAGGGGGAARAGASGSAIEATAPITSTAGSSGGSAPAPPSPPSSPRHVAPPACDAPDTIAAGVDA